MARTGCGRVVCEKRLRGHWGGMVASAALAVLGFPGCDSGPEPQPEVVKEASPVVREWRPAPTQQVATKTLGEDCAQHGGAECLSGVCIQVRGAGGSGRVCSEWCQQDVKCPSGWRCVSIVPGSTESVCRPPASGG